MNLRSGDVRYYTTNAAGQIDRLILDDVTGDLWTYGVLDDVRNLANVAGSVIDDALKDGQSTTLPDTGSLTTQTGNQVVGINLPSTSDILYGIIDGSIAGTLWQSLSSSTGSMGQLCAAAAVPQHHGHHQRYLRLLGQRRQLCLLRQRGGGHPQHRRQIPGSGGRRGGQPQHQRHGEKHGAADACDDRPAGPCLG